MAVKNTAQVVIDGKIITLGPSNVLITSSTFLKPQVYLYIIRLIFFYFCTLLFSPQFTRLLPSTDFLFIVFPTFFIIISCIVNFGQQCTLIFVFFVDIIKFNLTSTDSLPILPLHLFLPLLIQQSLM